ncbi:phosphoglycerate mutase (2,3-diphosphoglycerate-independent) [Candidatus Gottesmanbacteria bacterium RIFCSPHIGHO2_02_FULL_40_24]|nr:MAG: phosphoglycerate mutase (2,3-diphosphoglycerate-independent) [Candidatus Gottesmanbacteria bacterium RIFCSPHIGHO2_02_FULL_40_24]OGG21345.1 MAG: phosphoglycerate mutase (2,3-diphosphoglycerate-independent) [Candidatus Gottesmanbacteria bacterium RIFCSPLOWO2_01_FULL_40_10]OGG25980.1 MAG: phosphoglycerate mutase (2,3-diphosphoglycerate-independent) [Candidatus Gottesmanbacteria bacterium RIFCSPHIGHO2_12_FULL_40_13]
MNPVYLIILDGWGIGPEGPGNAISQAKLPYFNRLFKEFPHGLLEASGEFVGLPKWEDGNTETGHLNLGAGYIVPQDLARINLSIADGSFFQNRAFLQALDHVRKYESNLHLIGLIGSGGVHSNIEHLLALLQLIKEQDYHRLFLHLITDGRDSPPKSARVYLTQIENFLQNLKIGKIASIMGRYYAMDRDKRWDRTEKAYRILTSDNSLCEEDIGKIISDSYKKGITDEFIIPTALAEKGKILQRIKEKDSVIFFNYRIDRPRQLTEAFVLENFEHNANLPDYDPFAVKYFKKHDTQIAGYQMPFTRGKSLEHLYFVTMTEFSQAFHVSSVAFPPHIVIKPLGAVIEENGLNQLHMAESEKERFVTYYFNGQREVPFNNQDNIIVASPDVATYDLKPEMSAEILTTQLIEKIKTGQYHFTVINYANPDMVAHTGNIFPTIKACETVDHCLSRLVPLILDWGGTVIITGDHGNAEELINQKTGGIDTEHSSSPVPVLIASRKLKDKPVEIPKGILADISPTVLALLGLEKPKSMTGRNLLENIIDLN